MSEQWQEDEASLRSYDREQADLERQTDALVLKTLTSLVSAAEDLKSRLRRDTDSLLEELRRTKRGLENDISMAGAERQRLRDEAESERDRVLSEAHVEAERIVREAQAERESLLGEVREMEHRLRSLETQILQVLGATSGRSLATGATGGEHRAMTSPPAGEAMIGAAGVAPGVTTSPSPALGDAPSSASLMPSSVPTVPPPAVDVDDDEAASDFEVATTPLGEPASVDHLDATAPVATPESRSAATAEVPSPAVSSVPTESTREDEPELSFAAPSQPAAPTTTRTDEDVAMPTTPATDDVLVAAPASESSVSAPSAGADTTPAEPAPAAAEAPAPTAARGLQLVFDGVPGYQQAAAIERAVGDLVEDGEVEIIEFEQGQLVLQVEAANPRELADRLVARPPLPMRLVASGQDSATFQLTAG